MRGAVQWYLCALVLGCASAPAPTQTASLPPSAAPPVVAAHPPDAGGPHPLFRLPADVHPGLERVFLEVVPDREDFWGEVDVELVLDRPRQDLWVSARGLTFKSAEVRSGSARVPATVQGDDLQGVARVLPSTSLRAGPATLHIAFSGRFLTEAYGAYRSRTSAGWAAYTQFESIDARRAFPCFDEPGFKIPWEVTLRVPARLLAVSNTNVAEERAAGEGMKEVRFRRTRPLPSYLVAFGVGDFEVVAPAPLAPDGVRRERLQIRGVVPKGRGPELAYALKSGGELLGALERWFEIPFAYEKLDHLAAPDMDGAMENAGLITYVDDDLLETANSSDADRVGIASVVTHEMAHQWFGDLVTMRFWEDVWLNESFATFMAAKIVQQWDSAHRGAAEAARGRTEGHGQRRARDVAPHPAPDRDRGRHQRLGLLRRLLQGFRGPDDVREPAREGRVPEGRSPVPGGSPGRERDQRRPVRRPLHHPRDSDPRYGPSSSSPAFRGFGWMWSARAARPG